MINNEIENFKYRKKEKTNHDTEIIKIYYEGQYHANYKLDENILKQIIKNNIRPCKQICEIKLMIYYKNKKTSNLVMKNNITSRQDVLGQTNVVYEFKCPMPHDQVASYIGITQNTLSRRLTLHLQNGSIKQHFIHHHNKIVIRKNLVENTKIIERTNNRRKLLIKEALLIQQKEATINKQFDCFPNILKLYTKLENFPPRLDPNDNVKNLDRDLLNNNEEFNDGVLFTSTPIPNTTIDYMQRLERYAEKVKSNNSKYNLRSRNK